MKRHLTKLALCVLASVTPFACADTFNFNATLQTGTVNGTVNIDTATGIVGLANFTVDIAGNIFLVNSAPVN